jgi:3-oxoadipate enol-lactonase
VDGTEVERKMVERSVTVDNIEIKYCDIPGEGGSLFVLHGWCDSKERWLSIVPSFGLNFRTVIPDLPGFGNSGKPDVDYSLEFYSGVLRKFCEKIDFTLPHSTMIGHSFGGDILLHLSRSVEVKKIILVSTPILPLWQGVLANRFGPVSSFLFELGRRIPFIKKGVARMTVVHPEYVDKMMLEDCDKPTAASAIRALKDLAEINFVADVHALGQKVLLMYGESDHVVRRKQYRYLHSSVRTVVIPGVGHCPFLENKEMFVEAVRRFLADQ